MRSTLLTVALAAAVSALPAGLPAPRVLVANSLYDQMVHYATFIGPAQNIPQQQCPNPPFGTKVQKYYSTVLTDTQAILYRDDARREFVLAIPGTKGLEDQLRDILTLPLPTLGSGVKNLVACLGCTVHAGFLTAWESLGALVRKDLTDALKQYPGYETVVTGHSLGASLAQLAWASLLADKTYNVREGYSFGQPRTGNQAFANVMDKLSGASDTNPGTFHRVTHANDPIPNSIPHGLFYQHSRSEYWQENMIPSLASTFLCLGQEPADCNLGTTGATLANMPAHVSYAGLNGYNCNA